MRVLLCLVLGLMPLFAQEDPAQAIMYYDYNVADNPSLTAIQNYWRHVKWARISEGAAFSIDPETGAVVFESSADIGELTERLDSVQAELAAANGLINSLRSQIGIQQTQIDGLLQRIANLESAPPPQPPEPPPISELKAEPGVLMTTANGKVTIGVDPTYVVTIGGDARPVGNWDLSALAQYVPPQQ